MSKLSCIVSLAWMAVLGCSAVDSAPGAASETESNTGTLALRLTATDARGEQYRLRDADFTISGYSYTTGEYIQTNRTVSSETDPAAATINTRVLPGSYTVGFTDKDWYIEHVTASAAERVANVTFLGPASQYISVYERATSPVSFRFGVDGELLDFVGGAIEIGITVERPPGAEGAGGAAD